MGLSSKRRAGIGLVTAVALAFALTAALYAHAFSNPLEVTLKTSRAGLVMDPGNKVKMRGVEIGSVGSVTSAGDQADLVLNIDRDVRSWIPANVEARIKSTTVFGAKYVELFEPAAPSETLIADGAVLDNTGVTTELNTVFESLSGVLDEVDVTSLNSTLTVLSTTLSGRGDEIAGIAAEADAYLTKLEPLLPQLREDLRQVAAFARLGVDVSPALFRILENATTTSKTIATEQKSLDQLLVDLSLLGGQGAEVLGVNSTALTSLLSSLRPTSATLAAYSSELPCLLQGLDRTRAIMRDVIGGVSAGLRANLVVRSGLEPYTFPAGLPSIHSGTGPNCQGLPRVPANTIPIPESGEPE